MKRGNRAVLIGSTMVASWLGMQMVHELGHVVGAWLTGGRVARVVLDPFDLSRTELHTNPKPLWVVWAGPVVGVALPLAVWGAAAAARRPGAFVWRFFAGFCLIANGTYIAAGSFAGIGDSGEMLRHGAAPWQLWLFGALTAPTGLWLWHRLGPHFGFGSTAAPVEPRLAYVTLAAALLLLALGFLAGGY